MNPVAGFAAILFRKLKSGIADSKSVSPITPNNVGQSMPALIGSAKACPGDPTAAQTRRQTYDAVGDAPQTLGLLSASQISAEAISEHPPAPTISQEQWDKARARYALVKPAIDAGPPYLPRLLAIRAETNVSIKSLYRFIGRYLSSGDIRSLCDVRVSAERKVRINAESYAVIIDKFESMYASPQRYYISKICEAVQIECKRRKVPRPHDNTVRYHIKKLAAKMGARNVAARQGRKKMAEALTPHHGMFAGYDSPWSLVQIDHTTLDLILVDETYRKSIGRAFITVVFDLYSRMILGFYISLDPVGTLSTGIALCHAMLPKDEWLKERDITNPWPCSGRPAALHFDNAKEFLGKTLLRFCEIYDVRIEHRPLGTPRYGAHVERVIRTLNDQIHTLPGTTFSNIAQREDYNSEEYGCMTLAEAEQYVAEWITGVYHQKIHRGLRRTPQSMYTSAILAESEPNSFAIGLRERKLDERKLRLDLLPFEWRTVQRTGVQWDNLVYVGEVLGPYTLAKDEHGETKRFIFARDPRCINTCYFYAEEDKRYHKLSLRNPTRPNISIWEWNALQRRLVDDGQKHYSEDDVFACYDRLARLKDEAVSRTAETRRGQTRRLRHAAVQVADSVDLGEEDLWNTEIEAFEEADAP